MRNVAIERVTAKVKVTIANGEAESEAFYFAPYTMGHIHVPEWTAASIGFKVATAADGDFVPLYDSSGNLVEASAGANRAVDLPTELAGAIYVKLWSEASGVDVDQAADREIWLTLKG